MAGELRTNECLELQEKVALRLTLFLDDVRRSGSVIEPSIVFELKDVNYAASSFIRIILSCAQRLGKPNVSVVHANEFLQGLFRTVGLQELLRAS
jgi:hypothetical protein